MAAQPIDWMSAINANRINTVNPGGSQTWAPGKNGGPATLTTNLNPTLAGAQTQEDKTYAGAVKNASGILSKPTLDFSKIPKMTVNPGLTGQNAIMKRLGPQIQRERAGLHTQLVNWGLQPGTEAYNEALARQGETENDLLSRAAIGGIGLDTDAHRQGVSDQQAAINTPLNAINTMGGNTSSNMSFGNGTAGSVQDTLAPMQAMYGQQTTDQNAKNQNTMDWLNFAVNGAKAIPQAYDWLSSIWP